MPAISVILPVYNGEKYVVQTVRSVLGQTFKDFELLIINDGSQDRTLEVLQSTQDPRIKILSYPNGGLAASRNRGIAQAKGDFIAFIDADDLWMPDKLECQLKALLDNPSAAVAYSWVDFIDPEGQFICHGSHLALSGDVYANLLEGNFTDCASNVLVRKEAFEKTGVFDGSVSPVEDLDLYLKLASHFYFALVQKPQVLYRILPNSLSANLLTMERMGRKALNKAFNRAPSSFQYLKRTSFANFYRFLFRRSREVQPSKGADRLAAKFLLYSLLYGKPAIPGDAPAVLRESLVLAARGWSPFLGHRLIS